MKESGTLTASDTTILKGLCSPGTVNMTGCNLCSAGGYVDTRGSGWASFTNCTVRLNSYFYGDGTTARGCTFIGNNNVYETSYSSLFDSCTFKDGATTWQSVGTFQRCTPCKTFNLNPGASVRYMIFYKLDGGIYINNAGDTSKTTTIEYCKFLGNNGRGVVILAGNAVVESCIFCENSAGSNSAGGAVYYVGEARSCRLANSCFINNKGGSGASDAHIQGPSGSSVTISNTTVNAKNFLDVMINKISKGGSISYNALPTATTDDRRPEDFL